MSFLVKSINRLLKEYRINSLHKWWLDFVVFKCASGHQILFSGDVFSFPSFILLPGETLVSLVAHRAGDLKKLLIQPRRVEGGETGLACVGRWDWTPADTTA